MTSSEKKLWKETTMGGHYDEYLGTVKSIKPLRTFHS